MARALFSTADPTRRQETAPPAPDAGALRPAARAEPPYDTRLSLVGTATALRAGQRPRPARGRGLASPDVRRGGPARLVRGWPTAPFPRGGSLRRAGRRRETAYPYRLTGRPGSRRHAGDDDCRSRRPSDHEGPEGAQEFRHAVRIEARRPAHDAHLPCGFTDGADSCEEIVRRVSCASVGKVVCNQ